MEKANLNFSGKDNIIKSICWIFSVLGWLMYLICGWISLKWLDQGGILLGNNVIAIINSIVTWPKFRVLSKDNEFGGYVMTIQRRSLYKIEIVDKKIGEIYPLQLQTSVIYIIVILTMVFALFGFIVYMIKSTCKKEGGVFDGMMGDWTRLHSIPLFIAAGLFLVGICYCERDTYHEDDWEDANIAGTVLVILGLASLIFIYIKTDLPDDWLTASIKKGAYSTLIALEWYYFCYIICDLRLIDLDNNKDYDRPKKKREAIEGCGIAMPIIEGVVALVFAFFFKDVIIALMNVAIFAGAMGYYFSIHKDFRKKDVMGGNGVAEGIIDLVFLILSIVVIVLLIIMKKKECLK